MKETIKIIGCGLGILCGVYLFFALALPWGVSTAVVMYYQANTWACEQKGGEYRQVENDKGYKYFECNFTEI